jgi:eukaryotic-like serine/threonine-protein kinase
MSIPSEELEGLEVSDGWIVIEKISKHPGATGGFFSCGYKVKKEKNIAFLKALDFSEAFSHPDPARRLQELTEAFNFERDLLYKCKDRHLSKIVTPICDGSVDVKGFPAGIGKVYFIVFDLADGDIRKIRDTFIKIDIAFSFRALHNTAVGLQQLHKTGVAHQDLKPSNVMGFKDNYKIGDLGRSSDINKPFKYDNIPIPGDRNYAPIEQFYGYHFSNDFSEKIVADLYLFGSLFFFFFSGLSASQALNKKAQHLNIVFMNRFEEDLPEWERVFSEVLIDLQQTILPIIPQKETEEVITLIKYLCSPDPRKRGYPKKLNLNNKDYSLERFISRLDFLAKKAELGII